MDLSYRIASAENTFKNSLEIFFSGVFGATILSSHNLDHHQRVWKYAQQLLLMPKVAEAITDETLPEKLIIASYLHDLGMAADSGPKHGTGSKLFCEKFLLHNNLKISDYREVLDAIENHDNKDYISGHTSTPLLSILSLADDMDAFGYIGIYRYLEIYITRKIPHDLLGHRIQENVTNRFRNLSENFNFDSGFIEEQRLRYETVCSFFKGYNHQLNESGNIPGTQKPYGYCGVAELVETGIKEKLTLAELFELAAGYSSDKEIDLFFSELKKELSEN